MNNCILVKSPVFQKENLDLIENLLHAICQVNVHLRPLTSAQRTGRLALHAHNWAKITSDQWVLTQVQGHKLELTSIPHQRKAPEASHMSSQEEQQLWVEIHKFLEKGAIAVVATPLRQCFISRMFLIPKKDGTMKPIIDLRELNKFIHWEHSKMEGIHLIEMLLQEGDWMVKLDLKDTYFAVPIHLADRKYLTFQFSEHHLPVRVPSIRPLVSPESLYKDHEASYSMAETDGLSDDQLHRRQPHTGSVPGKKPSYGAS